MMTRLEICVVSARSHHQPGNADLSFKTVPRQQVHSSGNLKIGRRGVADTENINPHH